MWAFPLFCLILSEYMNVAGGRFWSFVFNIVVIYTIFGVILLLSNRAWVAGTVLGALSLAFGWVNYLKIAAHGDPLFPLDFAMLRNAGEISAFSDGMVSIVPWFFWFSLVIIVFWVAVFFYFKIRLNFGLRFRVVIASSVISVVTLLFVTSGMAGVMRAMGMDTNPTQDQHINYAQNGFIGGFMVNLMGMGMQTPNNYSQEAINAIISDFSTTKTTNEPFDIIIVLSESFFDVRILDGVQFYPNPLPNFDRVRGLPNAYSGLVYTNALTGGTIRPEFEVLTSLTTDFLPAGALPFGMMNRPITTNVSHLRDLGYRTIGLHPFTNRIYSRYHAYPLMGFDNFFAIEQLEKKFNFEIDGNFISDESFFPVIEHFLGDYDEPSFIFAITIQNHQPFTPVDNRDIIINVASDTLSRGTLDAVKSYAQGLYATDKMLGMLVDLVDNRERPTVLLFFGDHLPNLGGNLAAFTESGIIDTMGLNTPEMRGIMYSTPFVIYSNRELDGGVFEQNTDNHISTYYLMPVITYKTGLARTAHQNLLLDIFPFVPFYNERLLLPVNDDNQRLSHILQMMTYDRLAGNGYSE